MDASKKFNFGRGVGFVEGEVEVDTKFEDGDGTWKVGSEEVWLGPVGLPKGGRDGIEKSSGSAVGFVRADCPRSKG